MNETRRWAVTIEHAAGGPSVVVTTRALTERRAVTNVALYASRCLTHLLVAVTGISVVEIGDDMYRMPGRVA